MGKVIAVKGLGNASGLFDPQSSEARAAELVSRDYQPQSPKGLLGPQPGSVLDYLTRREAQTGAFAWVLVGDRTDNPNGYPLGKGPRMLFTVDNIQRWLSNGDGPHSPMWT